MQLADDDALGAVDDEGAVFGHQRNFAEEDFLFLDVANALAARLGIFIEDGQPNRDFERRRVGHAALFALRHVVLQLQADRVAAAVAEGDDVAVEGAALVAEDVARVERIGLDGGAAAVAAGGAQVMQPLEVAALAFPVADRVVDKLELAQAAEIGDRENAT